MYETSHLKESALYAVVVIKTACLYIYNNVSMHS